MRKPTLGIVVDSFLPRWDGVSRALIELIPRLLKHFNFRLIVPRYPGERPHFDGMEYRLFPMLPVLRVEGAGLPIASAKAVRNALDGVDLLWTHSIGSLGGKALKVATERSIPIISMIHSIEWEVYSQNLPIGKNLFRTIWRRECRRRYQHATTILTPSEATASTLRAEGFEPPIVVTPLGVDTDRFRPLDPAERRERRRSLGISDDTFVFGYLGRFGAEKNLELLIRAFNELNHPRSHLLMVGGKSDSLETLNQHPNTTFKGSTTTPEVFYPLMDAYVLPSLSESAPLAILEAMACGVIPLSTPVGNVPSYLNEKVGFLFSPSSTGELVSAMQSLLDAPDELEVRRAGARALVMREFDWQASAQRIAEIMHKALNQPTEEARAFI